eukprot:Sspe_Gene.115203::Locus_102177_Transcript_1_1_Confidence_1.000_Length_2125::g.115203::m.115203
MGFSALSRRALAEKASSTTDPAVVRACLGGLLRWRPPFSSLSPSMVARLVKLCHTHANPFPLLLRHADLHMRSYSSIPADVVLDLLHSFSVLQHTLTRCTAAHIASHMAESTHGETMGAILYLWIKRFRLPPSRIATLAVAACTADPPPNPRVLLAVGSLGKTEAWPRVRDAVLQADVPHATLHLAALALARHRDPALGKLLRRVRVDDLDDAFSHSWVEVCTSFPKVVPSGLLSSLLDRLLRRPPPPAHLVGILHRLAKAYRTAPEAIARFCKHCVPSLPLGSLTCHQLVLAVRAVVRLEGACPALRFPSVFRDFTALITAPSLLLEMTVVTAGCTMWICGTMHGRGEDVRKVSQVIPDVVGPLLGPASPAAPVVTMVWGFCKCGEYATAFQLAVRVPVVRCGPVDLCTFLWCLAKMRRRLPSDKVPTVVSLTRLAARLLETLPTPSPSDCTSAIKSLSLLRVHQSHLVRRYLHTVVDRLGELSLSSLSGVAWALAKGKYPHLVPFLDASVEPCMILAEQDPSPSTRASVASVVWAMAVASVTSPHLPPVVLPSLAACSPTQLWWLGEHLASATPPHQLPSVVTAFARLRPPSHKFMESVAALIDKDPAVVVGAFRGRLRVLIGAFAVARVDLPHAIASQDTTPRVQ